MFNVSPPPAEEITPSSSSHPSDGDANPRERIAHEIYASHRRAGGEKIIQIESLRGGGGGGDERTSV